MNIDSIAFAHPLSPLSLHLLFTWLKFTTSCQQSTQSIHVRSQGAGMCLCMWLCSLVSILFSLLLCLVLCSTSPWCSRMIASIRTWLCPLQALGDLDDKGSHWFILCAPSLFAPGSHQLVIQMK